MIRVIVSLFFVVLGITLSAQVPRREILNLGLPVVAITTVDGQLPSSDYIDAPDGCFGATITNKTKVYGRLQKYDRTGNLLYDSGDYKEDVSGMLLKIHGNTSARSPKKPFKIKLEKKADLLCRGDNKYVDKEFVLIKPLAYSEGRSPITFMIGTYVQKIVRTDWCPENEFVNVVINGEYYGLYSLSETVKRNSNCRINVDKDNGFIVEVDPYWWNEDLSIETSIFKLYLCPFKLTFKYPDSDDVTQGQVKYLDDYFRRYESQIRDSSVTDLIDMDTWVRWLLAHDILGTSDASGSNMFVYKYDTSDSTKLKMGPLWDFDTIEKMNDTWANIRNSSGLYFAHLLNNPLFCSRYIEIYNDESEKIFDAILTFHNDLKKSTAVTALNASIEMDLMRWPGEVMDSANIAIEKSRTWFLQRKIWMDKNVPYMEISSGIDNIHEIPSQNYPNRNTKIFNLQGQRILSPQYGRLYIVENKKYFNRNK